MEPIALCITVAYFVGAIGFMVLFAALNSGDDQ